MTEIVSSRHGSHGQLGLQNVSEREIRRLAAMGGDFARFVQVIAALADGGIESMAMVLPTDHLVDQDLRMFINSAASVYQDVWDMVAPRLYSRLVKTTYIVRLDTTLDTPAVRILGTMSDYNILMHYYALCGQPPVVTDEGSCYLANQRRCDVQWQDCGIEGTVDVWWIRCCIA